MSAPDARPAVATTAAAAPLTAAEEAALADAALAAMRRAYAPYSHFQVGAALLCEDGTIVAGCNVENASYPAGLCAERVALGAAVAAGHQRFRAVCVATVDGEPAPPCGVCRQALVEFAPALPVLTITEAGERRAWALDRLLPHPFTPDWLRRS